MGNWEEESFEREKALIPCFIGVFSSSCHRCWEKIPPEGGDIRHRERRAKQKKRDDKMRTFPQDALAVVT